MKPYNPTTATFSIWRFTQGQDAELIQAGLTLAEAQAHCTRPDTHGTTNDGDPWFDGYREDEDNATRRYLTKRYGTTGRK